MRSLILGIVITIQYNHNQVSLLKKPLVMGVFVLGCVGALLLPSSADAAPLTRATAIILTLSSVLSAIFQLWRGKDYKKNKLRRILDQLARDECTGLRAAKGRVQFCTVD
jgi:hypothetical protein